MNSKTQKLMITLMLVLAFALGFVTAKLMERQEPKVSVSEAEYRALMHDINKANKTTTGKNKHFSPALFISLYIQGFSPMVYLH